MRKVFIAILMLVALILPLGVVAPTGTLVQEASALENCSVSVATPYIASSGNPNTWGKFSCPNGATVAARWLKVCLYQNGYLYACNYTSLKSYTTVTIYQGCPSYSASTTARFTAWVWFQDQYGATYAAWSGNSYFYKRCY